MSSSGKKRKQENAGCLAAMGGLCLAGMALALLIYLAFFLIALAIFAGLIALSVYFWKTEKINLDKKKRAIILAISWVVILSVSAGIVASTAQSSSPSSSAAPSSVSSAAPSSSIAAGSEAASSEADSDLEESSEAASAPASSADQSAGSSAASVAPSDQSEAESEEQVIMVWVPTNGGTKYHSRSGCSNMKNPSQVTLDYAISHGYEPCKRCY